MMRQDNRCDLCGRNRGKMEIVFAKYGELSFCRSCTRKAVKFAYEAACTFGGTYRQDETPAPPPREEE